MIELKRNAGEIRIVENPADIDTVRELFVEYARSLEIDLCFQHFEKELAELPGEYGPPHGRLLLAREVAQTAGCVALRRVDQSTCEMKRLYVRPSFRRRGLGRRLVEAAIEGAARIGYERMRLDTLSSMKEALSLYQGLNFRPIPAYYANPCSSPVFMELKLC